MKESTTVPSPRLLILAALLMLLAACDASPPPIDPATAAPVDLATAAPAGLATAAPAAVAVPAPTVGELEYVTHMVEHHRQALRMVAMLRERGGVPYRISNLADHIAATQGTELADMTGFLDAWGKEMRARGEVQPTPAHSHMEGTGGADRVGRAGRVDRVGRVGPVGRVDRVDREDRPDHAGGVGDGGRSGRETSGMVSEARLGALRSADGVAAGQAFLRLMIAHHRGAVEISAAMLPAAENPWVISLARHVIADQRAEIAAMRRATVRLP